MFLILRTCPNSLICKGIFLMNHLEDSLEGFQAEENSSCPTQEQKSGH